MTGADLGATLAATFVDEWCRAGVTDVVVAPGSRSTPLTLAVLQDDRLRVHLHIDERSAAFAALGLGLASGRPAPVVTTSGTAAVELHPAVVEAHHAAVPMIVCTADRPPELQGIGAPQTIQQPGLYGDAVRRLIEVEPATAGNRALWRSWAAQSVLAASSSPAGPVHVNLAFREPLLGQLLDLPPGRPDGAPWHRPESDRVEFDISAVVDQIGGARTGVLVAGRGCDGDLAVLELADRLRWPVLVDPTSGLRVDARRTVAAFDALLRSPVFEQRVPTDLVIQFGAAPASKVLRQWIDRFVPATVVVGEGPELPEPGRDVDVAVRARPGAVAAGLLEAVSGRSDDARRSSWQQADAAAQAVLSGLQTGALTEPVVARTVVESSPGGGAVLVSSSMPIRDVEWYGPNPQQVAVLANRGANGIDGVVSTALGVALTGRPTVALLGDIAFLHDSNGLLGAAERGVDLTVVVVDNDGGGIFSFLPQASVLAAETFEQAFGTPHGLDLVAVARALGVRARRITEVDELRAAAADPTGVEIVVVPTDRATNVAEHEAVHAAIHTAVASVLGPAD